MSHSLDYSRMYRPGPYRCVRCTLPFKLGEKFYSDAPGHVYHLGCYVADVKEQK